jgi:myosin heavy subunit
VDYDTLSSKRPGILKILDEKVCMPSGSSRSRISRSRISRSRISRSRSA